jgi:hypothetical protein
MTSTCDIWVIASDHERLMRHLFPGDRDEHGAVMSAGVVETSRGLRLLINGVIPAVDGKDYVAGEYGYRALKPTFIHRQITRCRDQRLAYIAVHNHNCNDAVGFSRVDIASHERGYPALRDIGRGVPVGALVYGRRAVEADIWLADGRRLSLGEYRILGSTVGRLYARPRARVCAAAEHDRQVRMFGAAGQALLAAAKVGVVGLGGVGSLVVEHLARLGVVQFVIVDSDLIEDTNLSRVVGATRDDLAVPMLKTEIAARHIREVHPRASITAISDDVAKASVSAALRDCDAIFLAADSMRARLVVNAIAHQYFVPVIQLGAKVRSDAAGSLTEAMSVIRHVRPGNACLWCNGWIDTTQLALEAKSDQERKDQAYGTDEPNPSVITLNAVAAAHGVNDFLFDFLNLRPADDVHAYEHHRFVARRVDRVVPRRDPACRECVRRLGMGDAIALPALQG